MRAVFRHLFRKDPKPAVSGEEADIRSGAALWSKALKLAPT
jgi:hypothetical protein